MTAFKKIICILLCVILLFATAVFAVCVNGSEEANNQTSLASDVKSWCGTVTDFLESVAERIKRVLGIGYDKVDVRYFCNNAFLIPGLNEDFVPQGLCYVEELSVFAVSGYVKGGNSRIYLVDDKTGETKKLVLKDFDLHAGGIASHKNSVYVSAGGSKKAGGHIYIISTEALKKAKDGDTVSFEKKLQVPVRASALCASDDMLIVAEFYEYKDYAVNKVKEQIRERKRRDNERFADAMEDLTFEITM